MRLTTLAGTGRVDIERLRSPLGLLISYTGMELGGGACDEIRDDGGSGVLGDDETGGLNGGT